MRGNYIDYISAYCDGWCERCTFTDRCSHYAIELATAMCGGNLRAGLELAIGAPPPADPAEAREREAFMREVALEQPSEAEMEEAAREEEEKHARVRAHPLSVTSRAIATVSVRWLRQRGSTLRGDTDATLREALSVASWDATLIAAKLYRALHGREGEYGPVDDHPVQNDSNGSAKVALLSIERSVAAWQLIAAATADETPREVVHQLRGLLGLVDQEFPRARDFHRPGFDGPARRQFGRF